MLANLTLTLDLPDEAATAALAEDVAAALAAGDVVALSGDLGAGKTTFARALIRALADDPALEVPSPTFTLVQTYGGRLPVAHFDLYRLEAPEQAIELGIEEAFASGISLIEWPERLGRLIPAERLEIALGFAAAPEARDVVIVGTGRWAALLDALAA